MTPPANRIARLVRERLEDQIEIKKACADPQRNSRGLFSAALSDNLRFLAIGDWSLDRDPGRLCATLAKSVAYSLELVSRFERGDPIPPSFVSMLLYKSLFDALASEDLELSRKMASVMGGREKIEREHDHPFDYALGYTLKYFTLEERPQMDRWAAEFARVCEDPENADFRGYAEAFTGILAGDDGNLNAAFENIIAGHKRQSKGNGVFRDTEDELLCVWGVGLANLAKHLGRTVTVDDPLLPAALIQGLR